MVDNLEVSPASMPTKPMLTWSNDIKASGTTIKDESQVAEFSGGGFRFCRSVEEFTSGSYRYEINIDWGGVDAQVSFGICYSKSFTCDCGVYYFSESCIYCNYYPIFAGDFKGSTLPVPIKVTNNTNMAINFDLDSKKLFWELDGKVYDELSFDNNGEPVFVVVGMFSGKATIV